MALRLSIKNKRIGMIIYTISISALGIILKLQDVTRIQGHPFQHPFFQVFLMFFGESLGIFMYLIKRWKLIKQFGSIEASPGYQRATQLNMKFNPNPLLFIIPMILDLIGCSLLYISIKGIPVSVTQMIQNLNVLGIAVLSVFLFKLKLYRHHFLGFILSLGSIIAISMITLFSDELGQEYSHVYLGVISIVLCTFFSVVRYVIEEKIFKIYYINPFLVVGYQGIFGCIVMSVILIILQFIHGDSSICSEGRIENTREAFIKMTTSPRLMILTFIFLVLTGLYNGMRLVIGKYDSALTAATLSKIRTGVVWIFFVLYPYKGNEKFNVFQLLCLFVLFLGTIIFNEIMVIPLGDLSKNTKKQILKRRIFQRSYEDYEREKLVDSYTNTNKTTMSDKEKGNNAALLNPSTSYGSSDISLSHNQ